MKFLLGSDITRLGRQMKDLDKNVRTITWIYA